jgi:hypothetical protein
MVFAETGESLRNLLRHLIRLRCRGWLRELVAKRLWMRAGGAAWGAGDRQPRRLLNLSSAGGRSGVNS